MDAMAEIRLTFFQECEEQLTALENGLLSMQEGNVDSETVNAVFRAVHSIKGGAGAFKLDARGEEGASCLYSLTAQQSPPPPSDRHARGLVLLQWPWEHRRVQR